MNSGALARVQAEIRNAGGGRGARYPAKLRQEIVGVVRARRADGDTCATIAAELSLPYETLRRWAEKPRANATAMKRVEVVVAPTSRSLTLISPNGLRIEGAGIEEIVALVRALG